MSLQHATICNYWLQESKKESLVVCVLILVEIGYWFENWKRIRERPLRSAKKGYGLSLETDWQTVQVFRAGQSSERRSSAACDNPHLQSRFTHNISVGYFFTLQPLMATSVHPHTTYARYASFPAKVCTAIRVKHRRLLLWSIILQSAPRLWYTCICIYVCLYVCMYECMYVYMYVYTCMYVCMCVYVCILL